MATARRPRTRQVSEFASQGGGGLFKFRIETTGVQELLFSAAPEISVNVMVRSMVRMMRDGRRAIINGAPRNLRTLANRGIHNTVWPRKGKPDRRNSVADVLGVIYTTSAVPFVHEFGATIRPTSSQYMPVPIGATRSSSGRVKRKYRKSGALKAAIERGERLFPKRTKAGNIIYFRRPLRSRGKGRKIEPMFLLRREVTIKPTLGAQASWDSLAGARRSEIASAAREITRQLAAYTAKTARGVASGLSA